MRGCPGAARTRQPPPRHRHTPSGAARVGRTPRVRRQATPSSPARLSPASLRGSPRHARPLAPSPLTSTVLTGAAACSGVSAPRPSASIATGAPQRRSTARPPALRSDAQRFRPCAARPGPTAERGQGPAARPSRCPAPPGALRTWQRSGVVPESPRWSRPPAGAAGGPGGTRSSWALNGFPAVFSV